MELKCVCPFVLYFYFPSPSLLSSYLYPGWCVCILPLLWHIPSCTASLFRVTHTIISCYCVLLTGHIWILASTAPGRTLCFPYFLFTSLLVHPFIVLFYSCLSLNFRDFLAATSDILVSRTHSSSNSASVAFILFLSLFTCFCSLLFPAVKMSPIWLTSQQTDSLLQLSCDSLLLVPTARSSTEITQVNFF